MKFFINPKIKKIVRIASWTVLSLLIGIFLAYGVSSFFKNSIIRVDNNLAAVIQVIPPDAAQAKPQYFYINKNQSNGPAEQPKVSATAFLVGDLNTGEVILSKKQDTRFPLASVSKLMTALVESEIAPVGDTATVSKKALSTEGKNGGLFAGERIKTSDLVYPLLLESSNDAAEVIAEHFGRDSFIKKMNETAGSLKMTQTSYADPSGLSSQNQSTVSDMFKLSGYLSRNKPELLGITSKRSFSTKKQSWSNISQFLGEDGYLGGKSGYTDPAKQTVVSLFSLPLGKTGNRPIAITLLQSLDRHKDVETILNYLKKNVYYGGLADATTDWVEKKIGLPGVQDPDFVTLSFMGDIMLDRGVRNSVVKNFNNDYSRLFEKPKELVDTLKKSDIVFANLEGPASDVGVDQKNLYSFRMDPAVVPALKGAGFSILSVANNHVADWSRAAYIDTLSRLKENEILYAGGGNNKAEAETPAIIEKYGIKIGFLGFTDKGPDSMAAGPDAAGVLLASDPDFDGIIKRAAAEVDFLVVSFHFGEEYQAKHNARQETLAHKAADDGAKLVIGAHPHVVEDFEVYKNSYIAYSLGNFIFDQAFSAPTMQGALLNIKLGKDGSIVREIDTVKLNSAFQPESLIKGKEEKLKFQEIKN